MRQIESRTEDLLGSWERPPRRFIIVQSCCSVVLVAALAGIWARTFDPLADIRAEWLAASCIIAAGWGLLQSLFWLYFGRRVSWRRRLGLGGLYLRPLPWLLTNSVLAIVVGNFLGALVALPAGYYSDDLEGGRWLCAVVASLLGLASAVSGFIAVMVVILPVTWFLSTLLPARTPPPDAPYANDFEEMWPGERLAAAGLMVAIAAALVAAVFAALPHDDGMPFWCVATWVVATLVAVGCVVANNRTVKQRKATGKGTPFDDGVPVPGFLFWLNR